MFILLKNNKNADRGENKQRTRKYAKTPQEYDIKRENQRRMGLHMNQTKLHHRKLKNETSLMNNNTVYTDYTQTRMQFRGKSTICSLRFGDVNECSSIFAII